MALSNFFRVNMPYCIDFKGKSIVARNREYAPLNTTDTLYEVPDAAKDAFFSFVLLKHQGGVMDLDGGGQRVFLYNDRTNPSDPGNGEFWSHYELALRLLSDMPVYGH